MKDFKLSGIHPIRRYLWDVIQNELGWETKRYRSAVPLITPQQSPEFNDLGAPYIVYNYAHMPPGTDYYVNREQAIFTIYSGDEAEVRECVNLMYDYFKAHDDSAKLVNKWIMENGSDAHKRFNYLNIRVTSSLGPRPARQEGGRHEGTVSIHYEYTKEDNIDYGLWPVLP